MADARAQARTRRAKAEDLTVHDLLASAGVSMPAGEFVRQFQVVVGGRDHPAPAAPVDPSHEFDPATRATLEAAGADFGALPDDRPTAADRTRTVWLALLADSVTPAAVAALLARDVSRVRQRIRDRSLWSIEASGGQRLPRIQFDDHGEIPGMADVLRALPADLHPVSVFGFLTRPNPNLVLEGVAVAPRDWLRCGGEPARAVELARTLLD